MEPRLEALDEKRFVGKNITISLANNRTRALWQSFMPDRKEITNSIGHELYSIEVYPPNHFDNFSPHAEFKKWAAVEVTDVDSVPDGMHSLRVPAGLSLSWTNAVTASPQVSSGTPTTAAKATDGWPQSTSSTSRG